jgi:uncharacterized protein YprB with RNaseH-like and TPR domain
MKTIYDRISERLKGWSDNAREYDIIEEGEQQPAGRFAWGMDPAEYSRAKRLKAALLKRYAGQTLAQALPGEELRNDAGGFYCIRNEGPIRFEVSCPDLSRQRILSDLKLIFGIGSVKERELKKEGYRSIPDLAGHPRFGEAARLFMEQFEASDTCGMQEMISRWYPKSHPLSFFVSSFHSPEDFVLLDIETLGLFSRPIILIGIAQIDSGRIVFHQYLLRSIDEEPAALSAVKSHIGKKSAYLTFNGRAFDLPYIQERFFYYGLQGDLERAHFDVLPYSRRAWGEESPNCRLVTLERFLFGEERFDDVPSALVPEFYETYMQTGNPGPLVPIVEHNRKDLETLARLFSRLHELWGR